MGILPQTLDVLAMNPSSVASTHVGRFKIIYVNFRSSIISDFFLTFSDSIIKCIYLRIKVIKNCIYFKFFSKWVVLFSLYEFIKTFALSYYILFSLVWLSTVISLFFSKEETEGSSNLKKEYNI